LETYTNIITGKSDIISFDEFVDLFNKKMGVSIIKNESNAEMGNPICTDDRRYSGI